LLSIVVYFWVTGALVLILVIILLSIVVYFWVTGALVLILVIILLSIGLVLVLQLPRNKLQ
jgi:hypothetical protein